MVWGSRRLTHSPHSAECPHSLRAPFSYTRSYHIPRVCARRTHRWETALRSEGIEDPEGRAVLGQSGYEQCLVLLFTGLIECWNANSPEGKKDIADSWRDDSKGKDCLTRDDFYDALFELADVWTETVEAQECTRAHARAAAAAAEQQRSSSGSTADCVCCVQHRYAASSTPVYFS